jgi:hypothetical protein
MKVDPAASLRGQHTEQNTITEYMIFEFTAYTATQSLQHRWVMDPGSDVHICNKARSNWKQTSLPSSEDTLPPMHGRRNVFAYTDRTLTSQISR